MKVTRAELAKKVEALEQRVTKLEKAIAKKKTKKTYAKEG